jgi:hypothetical protein
MNYTLISINNGYGGMEVMSGLKDGDVWELSLIIWGGSSGDNFAHRHIVKLVNGEGSDCGKVLIYGIEGKLKIQGNIQKGNIYRDGGKAR